MEELPQDLEKRIPQGLGPDVKYVKALKVIVRVNVFYKLELFAQVIVFQLWAQSCKRSEPGFWISSSSILLFLRRLKSIIDSKTQKTLRSDHSPHCNETQSWVDWACHWWQAQIRYCFECGYGECRERTEAICKAVGWFTLWFKLLFPHNFMLGSWFCFCIPRLLLRRLPLRRLQPSFTHNFVTNNFVTPHLSHTADFLWIWKRQWWCSCTRLAGILGPSPLINRWNPCFSMIVVLKIPCTSYLFWNSSVNVTELACGELRIKENTVDWGDRANLDWNYGEPRSWTACSTVQTEILQVQGGDQPPLPTNGNSFVARSMPKVLHAPAAMCIELSCNEFTHSTAWRRLLIKLSLMFTGTPSLIRTVVSFLRVDSRVHTHTKAFTKEGKSLGHWRVDQADQVDQVDQEDQEDQVDQVDQELKAMLSVWGDNHIEQWTAKVLSNTKGPEVLGRSVQKQKLYKPCIHRTSFHASWMFCVIVGTYTVTTDCTETQSCSQS